MKTLLFLLLVVLPLVLIYVFALRPVLKETPRFKEFYKNERSFFLALKDKFAGIKQKVATVVIALAGTFVTMWDIIAPAVTGQDFGKIVTRVPPEAWPFIMMGMAILLQLFRHLAERRER